MAPPVELGSPSRCDLERESEPYRDEESSIQVIARCDACRIFLTKESLLVLPLVAPVLRAIDNQCVARHRRLPRALHAVVLFAACSTLSVAFHGVTAKKCEKAKTHTILYAKASGIKTACLPHEKLIANAPTCCSTPLNWYMLNKKTVVKM
jgi:hypothetical protein